MNKIDDTLVTQLKGVIVKIANDELSFGIRDLKSGESIDKNGTVFKGNQLARRNDKASRILTYINTAFKFDKQVYSNTPGADGYFAWCGAFATFCSFPIVMRFNLDVADLRKLASVSNTVKNLNRICVKFDPLKVVPGDIVTVGSADTDIGTHFVLVNQVDVPNRVLYTIEGNGMVGSEVNKFEGVVARSRPFSACKWIVKTELLYMYDRG